MLSAETRARPRVTRGMSPKSVFGQVDVKERAPPPRKRNTFGGKIALVALSSALARSDALQVS